VHPDADLGGRDTGGQAGREVSGEAYRHKTVIVTGAANGIGRAIAAMAASGGGNVVLGDVDIDTLADVAASMSAEGASVEYRQCDVRRAEEVEALVALAGTRFGPPDAVFANAGILGPSGAPWDCPDSDFAAVVDVNLHGVWRTMKAVLPQMVQRGSGAIVATASAGGIVGAAGLCPYVASKHAVVGLVRSVALTVAQSGVRVNALCPSMIDTAMVDQLTTSDPTTREAILALMPVGRLGDVSEAAAAALWLASDQASFITGHALAVDGGYTAQ